MGRSKYGDSDCIDIYLYIYGRHPLYGRDIERDQIETTKKFDGLAKWVGRLERLWESMSAGVFRVNAIKWKRWHQELT
jgi:hypothetical protein